MTPEIRKLSDELIQRYSPKQLEELGWYLTTFAQDEYYKQHPEETENAVNR